MVGLLLFISVEQKWSIYLTINTDALSHFLEHVNPYPADHHYSRF